MASRRIKLAFTAALVLLGGGGYFLYSVFAAQAKPGNALAQAPLNTQVQVPPAFIMALDDSGSMNWETIFEGAADGQLCWGRDSTASPWSYIRNDGSYRDSGGSCGATAGRYLQLWPFPGRGTARANIPPTTNFAFTRSPDYNLMYFNPYQVYQPWLREGGTALYPDAVPTAALIDPRDTSSLPFDLTQPQRGTDNAYRFRFRSGMRIPAGTVIRTNGACAGVNNTGGSWVALSNELTLTGTGTDCNIWVEYFPATFWLQTPLAAEFGYTGADFTVTDPHGGPAGTLYRYEIRPENFSDGEKYQEMLQNFANFFQYYRDRNQQLIAGLTHALERTTNMRIGTYTINNRIAPVPMRDMAVHADRLQLYNDVIETPANGSTPNRAAVQHMVQQFQRDGDGAPVRLACQKNAGMLFTDGFSNDQQINVGNVDGGMGVPFADTHSNTLADIATQGYLNNLRPNLQPGRVPVPAGCNSADPDPRLDCNPDPHMNFYGVVMGASGNIFDLEMAQRSPNEVWDWVIANNPAWPPFSSDDPNAVDDIFHATVNTRGEFVVANRPEDIVAAMRRILSAVSAGASPSGSIALTGARIGAGSLVVTPRYEVANEGTDWSSTLSAERVTVVDDQDGRSVAGFESAWEASNRMPAHDSRQVFFAKGANVGQFSENNPDLELEDLCTKPAGLLYEDMLRCDPIESLGVSKEVAVRYLLGDRSLERSRGGTLRDRSTPLGDIVNSTPVVSAPTDDYGYRSLNVNRLGVNLGETYATYLERKRGAGENRRYMVYVGANDGMLHAFDGGMTAAMAQDGTAPDGDGGREKFAYIPATSLGHMGNLLFPYEPVNQNDQKFQHRYYVDGPVTVSDAHYSGGYSNGWSTVLVGTTGAGGRSVFALDVSAASRRSADFESGHRLWEISDLDTSLPQAVRDNIGHVLGRPVIVPVKTTDGAIAWKAIFGNGYNSESGKAVLFLVDIGSGNPSITMIEAAESGAGVPPGKNGLGNIVVVDRWRGDALDQSGRDGFADTVYAGDQKGALWKFDLRSPSPAQVTTPLFVTMSHTDNRQPITGGLSAAAGQGGGVVIYFGTGSFSFHGDPEDDTLQSLYAINDTAMGLPANSFTRSDLNGRTAVVTDGVRTLVDNAMTPGARGWYVDLPAGERFVGHPNIAAGTVFMPTYVPNPEAGGCATGGMNWLFGLNARTGAAALSNVYSSPGGDLLHEEDGTAAIELVDEQGGSIDAPVKDVGVLVLPRDGALVPADPDDPGAPPTPPGGHSCWMLISVAGAKPSYLPYPCGRQSWRQLQ